MADRPIYRLTLRATGDGPPAIIRLRRFLKAALRGYGLRCLSVEEMPEKPSSCPATASEQAEEAHGPGD
jgi:hypothetical protein